MIFKNNIKLTLDGIEKSQHKNKKTIIIDYCLKHFNYSSMRTSQSNKS